MYHASLDSIPAAYQACSLTCREDLLVWKGWTTAEDLRHSLTHSYGPGGGKSCAINQPRRFDTKDPFALQRKPAKV